LEVHLQQVPHDDRGGAAARADLCHPSGAHGVLPLCYWPRQAGGGHVAQPAQAGRDGLCPEEPGRPPLPRGLRRPRRLLAAPRRRAAPECGLGHGVCLPVRAGAPGAWLSHEGQVSGRRPLAAHRPRGAERDLWRPRGVGGPRDSWQFRLRARGSLRLPADQPAAARLGP